MSLIIFEKKEDWDKNQEFHQDITMQFLELIQF